MTWRSTVEHELSKLNSDLYMTMSNQQLTEDVERLAGLLLTLAGVLDKHEETLAEIMAG